MSNRAWLQILIIIIPIGVLTASLGARSIGNTVELTSMPVRVEIPESARAVRRRHDAGGPRGVRAAGDRGETLEPRE